MRAPEVIAKELTSARIAYMHAMRPHPATGRPDYSPEAQASMVERIRDLEAELVDATRATTIGATY